MFHAPLMRHARAIHLFTCTFSSGLAHEYYVSKARPGMLSLVCVVVFSYLVLLLVR